MSKTYIIAGTEAQAKLCALKYGVGLNDYIYLYDVDIIRGLEIDEIWITGTYYMCTGCKEVTQYCTTNNIKMIFKNL